MQGGGDLVAGLAGTAVVNIEPVQRAGIEQGAAVDQPDQFVRVVADADQRRAGLRQQGTADLAK